MFGHVRVAGQGDDNLEQTTFRLYRRLSQFASDRQFPHLLRVWNYFPEICAMRHGQERYHAFSAGRYRALLKMLGSERKLPAATAIGSQSTDMLIYFLSAREPGLQVENPRQISAFRYPPQYGPKSPAFSRAILKRWGSKEHLYISGTASVVGHESRHEYDVLLQLREILSNFTALIANARRLHRLNIGSISDLSALKVYLRDSADYEPVRRVLAEAIGDSVSCVFLQGEICRPDLRLEIDGLYCS
jgi:chorismate lyase/3-hydroxybenzoate synthase